MQYLFFSGKGGVGKTSLAAATAVHWADRGFRTLIVTTDPASNLADVFEEPIGPTPRALASVPGLTAQEIDAEAAAGAYRERALAPLRGLVPEATLASLAEQMNGPCAVEIAGFDEFVHALLRADYDRVVFDTAPTGHTLRLLALPAAWATHLEAVASGGGQTCIGPVDALRGSRSQYDRAMAVLRDGRTTQVVFVVRPERTAARETLRAARELSRLGISNQRLIVNGVIPEEAATHPFFAARRRVQEDVVRSLATAFGEEPVAQVPLLDEEIRGVAMLRALGRWVSEPVDAIW